MTLEELQKALTALSDTVARQQKKIKALEEELESVKHIAQVAILKR